MRKRGYPAEFRRRVLGLVTGGRRTSEVAADLGISEQTIYIWRRQDRIDKGLQPGLSSADRAELIAARRRIGELEAELAVPWAGLVHTVASRSALALRSHRGHVHVGKG